MSDGTPGPDGTDITFVAFDTPMRGICVICSQVKCGARGGVKALYKRHATIEQVGRRCADKMRAALDEALEALAPPDGPAPEQPAAPVYDSEGQYTDPGVRIEDVEAAPVTTEETPPPSGVNDTNTEPPAQIEAPPSARRTQRARHMRAAA